MVKTYGGVTRTVWEITEFSPNDITAATFMAKYNADFGPLLFNPDRISVANISGTTRVYLMDWGSTVMELLFTYTTGSYNDEGLAWGFQNEPTTHAIVDTSREETVTKEIDKFYGAISDGNGGYETKKISKLYGPISDGNGGFETKLIYEDTNA